MSLNHHRKNETSTFSIISKLPPTLHLLYSRKHPDREVSRYLLKANGKYQFRCDAIFFDSGLALPTIKLR